METITSRKGLRRCITRAWRTITPEMCCKLIDAAGTIDEVQARIMAAAKAQFPEHLS